MYNFLKFFCKLFFKVCFSVKVVGEIDLPKDSGYIICANHFSNFDPLFIACFTERPISFMAKKELFKNKLFDKFFRSLNAFPVDRDKGDLVALKTAIKLLKENKVFSLFPTGKRTKDCNDIGAFKGGIVLIANKSEVPVIPIRIKGNYRLFSKLELIIGEPIYCNSENKKEFLDLLKNRIINLG